MISIAGQSVIAQTPRLQATNRQVQTVLTRIETNTDIYRRDMQSTLNASSINNTTREERIMDLIDSFERSTDTMRATFDSRGIISNEISDMLNTGARIDRFMTRNRVTGRAATRWAGIKTDLNLLARYYSVTWNTTQVDPYEPTVSVYTATDVQLRSLIANIENKTDLYKRAMERSLDRSTINNTSSEDSINSYIARFEEATDRLRERFESRQSTGADATEVLNRARFIDGFMARSRMNRGAENQWSSLRNDLNTLATYYRVSWDWNQQVTPGFPSGTFGGAGGGIDRRITGTFRLNSARSDNVTAAIDRAIGTVGVDQRDRTRRSLERRLASPEIIAIEKNGRTVSIGSSNSPQVTFEADGTARTETNARGRTVTTTATANRDGIIINYEGDRMNDFYVTFSPTRNDQLSVTRRIYLEDRNETITVSSLYDKINTVAEWPAVTSGPSYGGGTGSVNDFYIPNGTRLTATLRDTIRTGTSQVGDRFAMEITSPGQYSGGIIEGRIVEAARSGRVTGRANLSLDMDTFRMNGRTYRFAGIIDSVIAANGDSVSVNNGGTVRDSNRTTQTATRAGIGAVLGAVIGAIAGGGSGAAIGAGVGAGAGAGTVLIAGRDSIELGPGSTFTVTATAPAGVAPIR
jgi:hypothetical protein